MPTPPRTLRPNEPHPSVMRGGRAYSQDIRDMVQEVLEDPNTVVDRDYVQQRRENRQFSFPSWTTVQRWRVLLEDNGHCRACVPSGKRNLPALRGRNLVLLSLYRLAFPKANAAHINAFLHDMNIHSPFNRFFSASQISDAEKKIGLTRKKGSTTAYEAYYPSNLRKRHIFWHMPYPFGIANIQAEDMIDIDECGLFLETCNKSYGKAYKGVRVDEVGPYSKSDKLNLLMAISGEVGTNAAPSRRWTETWNVGGTTIVRFLNFIRTILDDLPHGNEGRRYCFTMDNLSSHHNAAIKHLIYSRGHLIAFRAPYYAKDGPIEYVFNTLQRELNYNMEKVRNAADLEAEVGNAIFRQIDFNTYFRHVGFRL